MPRERSPVRIEGNVIAHTFWGKSWCQNLKRYSDFSNRLPRGRSYLLNGLVRDLQVEPGRVTALVNGKRVYTVTVKVGRVPAKRWRSICADCAGAIDSLVELLQGRLSKSVMERLCREETGLFPAPAEIRFSCTCPDWASMCKHVAATLYGIGARLDTEPELLFTLRRVNGGDLIARAGRSLSAAPLETGRIIAGADLGALFGLDLNQKRARAKRGRKGKPS